MSVGDRCILGGFVLVYQFRRIGTTAFLAYCSAVVHDVPAFVRTAGSPAAPKGINSIGMRRNGYDRDDIRAVKQAYRTLYRSKLRLEEARDALRAPAADSPAVALMLASIGQAGRGIVR